MSTNDILVRRSAEEARLAELRRLEQEAAERERARYNIANNQVSQLDQRYRAALLKLDLAARRLPDLTMQAPEFLKPTENTATANGLEAYASELHWFVQNFEREVDQAIAIAEAILADRIARTEALKQIESMHQAIQTIQQQILQTMSFMHETTEFAAITKPASDSSLATLQQHLARLGSMMNDLGAMHNSTTRRLAARELGAEGAGTAVSCGLTAGEAIEQYETKKRAQNQQAMQACLDVALLASKFTFSELSEGTQRILNFLLETSSGSDESKELIARLIARDAVLKQHAEAALALLANPPELLHAKSARSLRWHSLVRELEEVLAGTKYLSAELNLEYDQISRDAQMDLDQMYLEAEFTHALREQNFEAVYDSKNRLIILDLENPDVWLRETESLSSSDDSKATIATVVEMETNTSSDAHDATIINNVCSRLAKISNSSSKVTSEQAVIDRKDTIKRAQRPALKAFRAKEGN